MRVIGSGRHAAMWWRRNLENKTKQNKTTEESLLAQRFFQIYFTIAFRGNFTINYHINYS